MSEVLVRAAPAVDVLESDSGAVVLLRDATFSRVVRLSPLGAAVRAFTSARGMPLSSVAAHLTSIFGGPSEGDVLAATRAVVEELVREGVVVVEPA